MTTDQTHADPRRVPGWRRVLDAFMADPDRIVTNVELGQIPGVQAFHQRISDLGRFGYVLTSAIQLKPGRYAYALVGIAPDGAWSFSGPRPYADRLPSVSDDHDEYATVIAAAVAMIEARTHELAKRGAAPVVTQDGPSRREIDAAAVLAVALGDQVVGDWKSEDRRDVLALAHATRDELGHVRSVRALERVNADAAATANEAAVILQDVLGEPTIADLVLAGEDAENLVTLAGAARDEVARLRAALEAAPTRAPRAARAPRPDRGPTGPELMRKALEFHEQPMHSAKIAAWVLENGGAAVYKGKTPAATMAAQLATSNVKGGDFVKVSPGCYGLREWTDRKDDFGNELLELDALR